MMETKKCKPVLVKSDEYSDLILFKNINKIAKSESNSFRNELTKQDEVYKKLILISLDPDEYIGKGDLFYDTYSKFSPSIANVNFGRTGNDTSKKVIATQDQIPEWYINKFIEEYNDEYVNNIEIEMDNNYDDVNRLIDVEFPMLINGYINIINNDHLNTTHSGNSTINKLVNNNDKHDLNNTLQKLKEFKDELNDFVAPPNENGWSLSNLPNHFYETLGECINDVENYIKNER